MTMFLGVPGIISFTIIAVICVGLTFVGIRKSKAGRLAAREALLARFVAGPGDLARLFARDVINLQVTITRSETDNQIRIQDIDRTNQLLAYISNQQLNAVLYALQSQGEPAQIFTADT